jgi:hypothetical protein
MEHNGGSDGGLEGGGTQGCVILASATASQHNAASFIKSGCQSWGVFPAVMCGSSLLFFPHFNLYFMTVGNFYMTHRVVSLLFLSFSEKQKGIFPAFFISDFS